jgi:hypothetical protein
LRQRPVALGLVPNLAHRAVENLLREANAPLLLRREVIHDHPVRVAARLREPLHRLPSLLSGLQNVPPTDFLLISHFIYM